MIELAISPLELDQLTRPYWGQWDAYQIAQLANLAEEDCYQPKFWKAPALINEVIPGKGYASYGLHITPGALIFGFNLPAELATSLPAPFLVQIQDISLRHKFWDEPIPSIFLANFKPTYLSASPLEATGRAGSFMSLLAAQHPVVGDGLFRVEIWNTSDDPQRIELVLHGVEVVE